MIHLPFTLLVEKRTEEVPRWLPAATSVGSVVLAFVVSGVVLALIGANPLQVYGFLHVQPLAAGQLFRIPWSRQRR